MKIQDDFWQIRDDPLYQTKAWKEMCLEYMISECLLVYTFQIWYDHMNANQNEILKLDLKVS